MAVEQKLQTEITKFLKKNGCYVLTITVRPGIPTGCPDVIAFREGCWLGIEVKSSKNARFQPLQKETIAKLHDWSWCKAVYPENWPEVQSELVALLR